MKLGRLSAGELATLLTLLVAPIPTAADIDCSRIVIENKRFDFSKLGGPHSVITSEFDALANNFLNTTYTLDLCGTLKRKDDTGKACPMGTRVCAMKHVINKDTGSDIVEHVIPIAGGLEHDGGTRFEWNAERLSTSDAPGDESKEGVRLSLRGGMFEKQAQRAVVELRCSHNLTGTEGEMETEDKYVRSDDSQVAARDDGGAAPPGGESWPEKQLLNDGAALIWNSYEESSDRKEKVLSLTWHTKYACEVLNEEPEASKHWGLFTWLFFLLFLGTAAYLIFGSWLNYNRYGARGWDLLPHGDTIRDIPYLLKDWTRRFLNTVQSSGSRGGYSAV